MALSPAATPSARPLLIGKLLIFPDFFSRLRNHLDRRSAHRGNTTTDRHKPRLLTEAANSTHLRQD
jgi:hypothetical protein